MIEDKFQTLFYQPVRDSLKKGRLNNFTRAELKEIDVWVKDRLSREATNAGRHPKFPDTSLQGKFLLLQFHLQKNKSALKKGKATVFYKAMSMSLDFREYLGGLSEKEKTELSTIAHELLSEISEQSNPVGAREQERLKEQMRLICVHANQRYRDGKYSDSQSILDTLKETIAEKLQATNKCQTVLGSIYYLEGKILRNKGYYPDCERSLSKSIEAYTDWARHNRHPDNITLASYKNAMSLAGIAWCKNMRGFNRDALTVINAARLLILPTEWELDKAHLNMIYSDIIRTFSGEDDADLRNAIAIAQHSYDVFYKHPHERLQSRAAFTLALLNYYAGHYEKSEEFLETVKAFSKQKNEARWYANALILLARIRNKQEEFRAALEELLPEAISEAEQGKLDDRLVVAYIVKSESHLGLKQHREAIEALKKAQKVNNRPSGKDKAVNSERNNGWIFLDFAHTYLRDGDLASSKFYLDKWHELRGINYQWLIDYAAEIKKEQTDAVPDFVIRKDVDSLSWKDHSSELAGWLIEMAKFRTNSDKMIILAKELGITPKTLGQLRSLGERRMKKNDS